MTQVAISAEAAAELRERVARYNGLRDAVMILGPLGPNSRMAESAEENQLLDRAYGPAQRWVINIISLKELVHLRGMNFATTMVEGIPVAVVTGSSVNLRVELEGDILRISEQ